MTPLAEPDRQDARHTFERVVALVRRQQHLTLATTHADGSPQAAVVGVATSDTLELVLDTLASTRKLGNLRRDGRVALVAWEDAVTAQIEGVADEPQGAERQRVQAIYFATFPGGHERAAWPGITWVRIRPTWVRLSDFGTTPPTIVALDADAIAALQDRAAKA